MSARPHFLVAQVSDAGKGMVQDSRRRMDEPRRHSLDPDSESGSDPASDQEINAGNAELEVNSVVDFGRRRELYEQDSKHPQPRGRGRCQQLRRRRRQQARGVKAYRSGL